MFRSEFDLGAVAHPATGDGANEILPTEMAAGGFMFV